MENSNQFYKIAQAEASRLGHPFVETDHHLIGTLFQKGLAQTFLNSHGVTASKFKAWMEQYSQIGVFKSSSEIPMSTSVKILFEKFWKLRSQFDEARDNSDYVLMLLFSPDSMTSELFFQENNLDAHQLLEEFKLLI